MIITKILVVDDEDTILMLYELILTELGFKDIGIASNGKEALETVENYKIKPDLVILDHRMPLMSGFDAMTEILKINEDIKIIIASADTSIENLIISNGATSFLKKPFNIMTLEIAINNALNKEKSNM